MTASFDYIRKDCGGLDTLCANAGIVGETALTEHQDIAAFQRCLDVNLIGAVLAVQGPLPMMKAAGAGQSCSPDRPPEVLESTITLPMSRQSR